MAHDQKASASHDHKADARAAFMGLIFGVIALLGVVYTIVYLTNSAYSSHGAATTTKH